MSDDRDAARYYKLAATRAPPRNTISEFSTPMAVAACRRTIARPRASLSSPPMRDAARATESRISTRRAKAAFQFIHTTAKGGDPLWAGGTGWLSTPIYPAGLAIALCEKRGALTPPKRRRNLPLAPAATQRHDEAQRHGHGTNGRKPPQLTAQTLMRLTPRLPAGWAEQRKLLGFR